MGQNGNWETAHGETVGDFDFVHRFREHDDLVDDVAEQNVVLDKLLSVGRQFVGDHLGDFLAQLDEFVGGLRSGAGAENELVKLEAVFQPD